jgi:ABC-type sugar transport system permease subunit
MQLQIPATGSRLQEKWRNAEAILKRNWMTYVLLTPVLLVMGTLVWGNLINGLWMTFHEWDIIGQARWVGLENYQFVVPWEVFHQSLIATLIFSLVTFVQVGIALVATLAINNIRFQDLIGAIFVIPYTIPGLVSGTLWVYLANPDFGPFFSFLTSKGILAEPIYWQGNGQEAMGMIMFAAGWTYWPLAFIILYAAIQNIPDEHYETAKVYGASRIQMARYVTIPQMKGALLVALSIRTINNLTKVSQPLQMTQGGPGYSTSILGITIFNFTNARQFGLAMTVGVFMIILTMLFVIPYIIKFEEQAGSGRVA